MLLNKKVTSPIDNYFICIISLKKSTSIHMNNYLYESFEPFV